MGRRYWNFKDDDKTIDYIHFLLGFFPEGTYFGYDWEITSDLNLKLIQTTSGVAKIDENQVSTKNGIIKNPQGTVYHEPDVVSLPITANNTATPRIDTVVWQHQYSSVTGGTVGTYLVIQGTPAAEPTAPAITNVKTQVKIGELYLPDNTTLLNKTGVKWTKEPPPLFANHEDNFVYTNRVNVIAALTQLQNFSIKKGSFSVAGTTLTIENGNYFEVNLNQGFIDKIVPQDTNARIIGIRFTGNSNFKDSNSTNGIRIFNHSETYYNFLSEDFALLFFNGTTWHMVNHAQSHLPDIYNKNAFKKRVSLPEPGGLEASVTANNIALNDYAQFLIVTSASEIRSLDDSSGGTIIFVRFEAGATIKNQHSGATSGKIKITTPTSKDVVLGAGAHALFYKQGASYQLAFWTEGMDDGWHTVGDSQDEYYQAGSILDYINGTVAHPNLEGIKIKKVGKEVTIKGAIDTSNAGGFPFVVLPAAFRPLTDVYKAIPSHPSSVSTVASEIIALKVQANGNVTLSAFSTVHSAFIDIKYRID